MRPYQKINHWPGMFTLSRKNNLGKHLMDMRKKFVEYKYFPKTYILPADSALLLQ
jgi:tubulin polyglutamylase TTLL6/13